MKKNQNNLMKTEKIDWLKEFLKNFTIEEALPNIVYSIIAALIIKLFEYLLKPKSEVVTSKWDLINIVELIGCSGAILAVLGFILIYVFGTVDKIFTVESIAKIFVYCYGGFLLLHTIYSISKAIQGQGKLGEFFQGISLMILFPSIFIMLLFYSKMIVEIQSGLTLEEVDKANEGFRIYYIYLVKLVIISSGFWIFSKLINQIFKARE